MDRLCAACEKGNLKDVTSLLSNEECDLNACNSDGDSPLHIACKYGHLEIVRVLQKGQKCNLNIQNSYGNTPLHLACNSKSPNIVRLLLEMKCSINIPNTKGETAQEIPLNEDGDCLLHIACQWGDLGIVKYLINDERCHLNIQNIHLNTPLHVACNLKLLHIIRLFLERRCSTNIPNNKGETAQDIPLNEDGDCLLHVACLWGDVEIVRYLVFEEQCTTNIPNCSWNTPLHVACYKRSLHIIKLLLERKCSTNIPNKKGETAHDIPLNEDGHHLLHSACQWGDVNIVKYLITNERCALNAQNENGDTTLHIACYLKYFTIIRILLEKKSSTNLPNKKEEIARDIPLNDDGDCLLHIACQWGDVNIMRHLIIEENSDISLQNYSGNTPLHIACYNKSLSIIILLLEMRCSTKIPNKKGVNAKDIPLNDDGDCLLHIACQWGNVDTMRYVIIEENCDINLQNYSGNTPLHIACSRKSLNTIKILLEMRCSTNISNKKGETAQDIPLNEDGDCLLHVACLWDDVEIVRYLVFEEQCTTNIPNCSWNTPLHTACYKKSLNIIKLLLGSKCSTNIANKKRETAQDIPLNKDGDHLLHIACQWGDVNIMKHLIIEENSDINLRNYSGNTPLHVACYKRSLHIIKVLLQRKCSTNIPNEKGETAHDIPLNEDGHHLLHSACQWGDVNIVNYLITNERCALNAQNENGDTALHIACYLKYFTIIRILLEKKSSTNLPNKKEEIARDIPLNDDGDCLLHIACQWGDVNIMRHLIIEENSDISLQNYSGNTPLHIACYNKSLSIIILLLEMRCSTKIPNKKGVNAKDIPLNDDGDCLLHIACQWGNVDTMRYVIIEENCDINLQNYSGNTPLHIACSRKSLNTIKILLEMRCSTNISNKKGETAQDIPLNEDGDCLLHIACQWGDVDIVKYLTADEVCSPNVQSQITENTPLHIAAMYGQDGTIIQLLSCEECDPNIQNEDGDTPLHIAAMYGQDGTIIQLLSCEGCDLNVQNKEGDTPLHHAVRHNKVAIIPQLLSQQQCNVNIQNNVGDTPLHIAATIGQQDAIVQLLLCEECNLNLQNEEGDTPLHHAVRENNAAEVSQLLAHQQCNLKVKNINGDTPLHIACYRRALPIIRHLLERRCDTSIPNKKGETAQIIPLNEEGNDVLLSYEKCDLNIRNGEGDTPLHNACYRKSLDIIRFLLERRCSTNIPNKKSETAQNIPLNEDGDCLLHIACQWGDVGIVRYLVIDERCDPNVQSYTSENTPLHIAVKHKQSDATAQLLSSKECDPSIQNKCGDTPLHTAIEQNRATIISLLLAHLQCSANVQNKVGDTPLHVAATYGHDDATDQLLSCKECDLNIQNMNGDTPLHVAVRQNKPAVVSKLLAHQQCNTNAQNKVGDTPLHIAATTGQHDATDQLLSREECDPSIQNEEGDTPLHHAVRQNNTTEISILLAHQQCGINVQNKGGDTPLHVAVKENKTVKPVATKECNPNAQNIDAQTPLQTAVTEMYNDTIVELLSNKECDVNIQNKEGDTPLHIAVRQNKRAEISQLLAHQQCNTSVKNINGDTPLHIACYKKSLHVIKLLLQRKCSANIPNKKGETAQDIPLDEDGDCLLHIACQWGDVDIVRYLVIDERCDPNVQSYTSENTPLHIAVKHKQSDATAQLLSSKECDPSIQNKCGDTPLHTAIGQNRTTIISLLLAHLQCSANVQNKVGDTPLHVAATYGHDDATDQLLSCEECDLNIQNMNGDTPLHVAVRQNKPAVVSKLLAHQQCNTNAQNKVGDTPLHIAATTGQHDATDQLLSREECDPSIQNEEGDTPLHHAVRQNNTTEISILLAHQQCGINVQNKGGDTPLHVAVKENKTVKPVATKECNPNAQNIDAQTPLQTAVTEMYDDTIVELLSSKECDVNIQNKEGDTPLHIAVRQNKRAEISQLLAHQQCNTSVKNINGDTPLHIACYKKSLHVIKLLLERKCSTNIPNKKGETAHDIPLNVFGDHLLHIACQWVDVDIVKYLVTKERCDPNVKNLSNNTPLHVACYRKSFVIIRFFLERRCHTNIPNKKCETAQDIPLNDDGDCLLHIACQWGDVDIVRYLVVDENCDACISNGFGNSPLHVACYLGLLNIIRFFLEQKCSTNISNKKGETAQEIPLNEDGDCLLHLACQWADVGIVRYLIADQKCNLNIQNTYLNTAMHVACHMKLLHIVRLLLEIKCSTNIPNKKGETAQDIPLNENEDSLLHIACQWGDVDVVEYLITDERCDPNVQNVFKNTPLHIAVIYGQLNYTTTVQLLSYKECNLNIQNEKGDTPLHIACYWKSHNIIRLFLERRCGTSIHNKQGKTAQNIPLNEDGDTLLHIACKWGDVDIVRYLITDERCDPNVQSSMSKNVPLHIAVEHEQDDTIVQLLSCEECDLNIQNEDGDTPLHFAVGQTKIAAIFHLLANEQYNSKVQNKEGDTALHIACYRKSFHVIRLLLERNCSTTIPNKKGETAQDILLNEDGDCLLHIACQWGDVDIVKYLITDQRCSINIHNANLNTPLHIACYARSVDITRVLLEWRCITNIPNKKGETAQNIPLNEDGDCLLHIACQWGDVGIVRHLIIDEGCDPNIQNLSENTPLHIASEHCQNDLITQLLSCEGCNLDIQNMEGDTPLHIAARHNITPAVFHLLASKQNNPNILNKDNLSPLLVAIKHCNSSAATALLQHKDCDPTLCDLHGNTPLHLACIAGETRPEMVKVAKQLLTTVDPMCVNNAGQTPIELTTNYQLIQAISTFIKCETKQSVQTYINLFIVGNPETGKSTLVKAICKEASILWKIVPKNLRRVKNVPLHTAGIIPTTFRSKTFGNTVLYDLAGQVEYYTSHAAVIQSTVISTPPAFIVVVNLSESDEKISQTLRYWWSFIDNHAAQSSAPPEVILVGSHADIVKSNGKSVQEKMTQISVLLTKLPATFHFAGQVALDCRDPASKQLRHFCSLVTKSCTVLRQTADVDLHCHVLYAFLLERFQGKVACTVSDVTSSVKETSALLPQNADSLIPLISTLSDKGLLLLVKNGEKCADWWIILQKQALLGEINGTIFAPRNFRQHKDLSWSTGVVPFFKLKQEFPDYNPNMVTEFLINLEFCFKIEDHETLALLKDEAANVQDISPDVSDKYYFFPALVSVQNPLHVWEENDDMCCKCGWFYQSIQQDQFLTTQFLHMLILRLAFTFALKLDPGDSREDSLSLCRKCSVWKRGIGWLYKVPIETVVEVGLQHQSVIVMMRCPKGMETKCVQLRSEVIRKVIEAKDEHCKAVKMFESFIHPTDVKYPFTKDDIKCYSLTAIARATVEGEAYVSDHSGWNPVLVQDLLLFDPQRADTSTELLSELFSEQHSMDKQLRDQFLETLNYNPHQPALVQEEVGWTKSDSVSQHRTEPFLVDLLKFTCTDGKVLSVPEEIATKYVQFGAFILDDRNGSRVKIMAHKHLNDAERINTEILQEWLAGKGKQPVSWTTLVEVLRDIELTALAREIEAVKCPPRLVSKT